MVRGDWEGVLFRVHIKANPDNFAAEAIDDESLLHSTWCTFRLHTDRYGPTKSEKLFTLQFNKKHEELSTKQ